MVAQNATPVGEKVASIAAPPPRLLPSRASVNVLSVHVLVSLLSYCLHNCFPSDPPLHIKADVDIGGALDKTEMHFGRPS